MMPVTERKSLPQRQDITPSVAANWTQVLANLVDSGGTTWSGAQIIISFVPAPNVPGPYFLGDSSDFLKVWNVQADVNGYFDIGIPDNTTITPAGSTWQFTVAPAATQPAVIFRIMIAGYGMNISSIFTNQSYQLQRTLVQSLPLPRAYSSDDVAVPPNSGQIYYNTSANSIVLWANNQWNPLPTSGWTNNLTDMNDHITAGVFILIAGASANMPPPPFNNTHIVLEVFAIAGFIMQRVSTPYDFDKTWTRFYADLPPMGWTAWIMYTGTPV
jgi:hypothetical protein